MMARFIGGIQGDKGSTSRLGSKESGMDFHAQGWDIGISGVLGVDDNDQDYIVAHINGGSNGSPHPQGVIRATEEFVEFTSGYATVKVYKDGRIVAEGCNGSYA